MLCNEIRVTPGARRRTPGNQPRGLTHHRAPAGRSRTSGLPQLPGTRSCAAAGIAGKALHGLRTSCQATDTRCTPVTQHPPRPEDKLLVGALRASVTPHLFHSQQVLHRRAQVPGRSEHTQSPTLQGWRTCKEYSFVAGQSIAHLDRRTQKQATRVSSLALSRSNSTIAARMVALSATTCKVPSLPT